MKRKGLEMPKGGRVRERENDRNSWMEDERQEVIVTLKKMKSGIALGLDERVLQWRRKNLAVKV